MAEWIIVIKFKETKDQRGIVGLPKGSIMQRRNGYLGAFHEDWRLARGLEIDLYKQGIRNVLTAINQLSEL